MPRAHTPEERQRIRERLLAAGLECFTQVGLVKSTIADLARTAGIGKGSFYQFFESKELLFLEVQEQQEAEFKITLLDQLDRTASPREALATLLQAAATRLDDHPFLRLLLEPQTLAALTVRVDPRRLNAHRQDDRTFFIGLVKGWQERGWLRPEVKPREVFDVLVSLFVMSVQRNLADRGTVRRATATIAEALADRWCEP